MRLSLLQTGPALIALLLHGASGAVAEEFVWTGPSAGDWEENSHWSTSTVPNANDADVWIDAESAVASTVTLSSPVQVKDLTLDEGDTLMLVSGSLRSSGLLQLDGTLSLDADSVVTPNGPLLIGATGHLRLATNDTVPFSVAPIGFGVYPYQRNLGLISGSGAIETNRNLSNEGTILADSPDEPLVLRTTTSGSSPLLVNAGLLRSESGGTLLLGPQAGGPGEQVVKNYLGQTLGRIEAGPNSTVSLQGVAVERGVLSADPNGGLIEASGITNLTVQGKLHLTGRLTGTIDNQGEIVVLEDLGLQFPGSLTGGGQLRLGDQQEDPGGADIRLFNQIGVTTLTNEDNRILGRGTIDAGLGFFINRGVVDAGFDGPDPSSGGSLTISFASSSPDSPVVNAGTLRARGNNRTLILNGDYFERPVLENYEADTQGVIEALEGGRIAVRGNSVIRGGVVRSDATQLPDPTMPNDDSVVALGDGSFDPAVLESLRLEGVIGALDSAVELWGGIENTGALVVRDLVVGANPQLNGGGEVYLPSGGSIRPTDQLEGTNGNRGRLTNVDNTIRLEGVIGVFGQGIELVNRGYLFSTGQGSTTDLRQTNVVNSGLLKAEAGSILMLGEVSTPYDAPDAKVHAEAGAKLIANTISGGLITTDPSPDGIVPAGLVSGSLADVRNEGQVELVGGIAGMIENDGKITAMSSVIIEESYAELSGDGEFVLQGQIVIAQSSGSGPPLATLVNATNHTISGGGTIHVNRGTLLNHGAVIADSGQLRITTESQPGAFLHDGTLRGQGDGYFIVAAHFTNRGRVEAHSIGNRIDDFELVNASGAVIDLAGELTAHRVDNRAGATISGHGELLLDFQTPGDPKSLLNHGRLAPSAGEDSLFIRGGFDQAETGVLQIVVNGFDPSQHSVLEVNDLSTLGGELSFDFDPALGPVYGDEVRLLLGPTQGEFAAITGLPTLDSTLHWAIDYQPDHVSAVVALAGDFNLDGAVDAADYAVWRQGLGTVYDQQHYERWRMQYGQSVPSSNPRSPAAVPTPATLPLLLLASWLAVRSRATRGRRV